MVHATPAPAVVQLSLSCALRKFDNVPKQMRNFQSSSKSGGLLIRSNQVRGLWTFSRGGRDSRRGGRAHITVAQARPQRVRIPITTGIGKYGILFDRKLLNRYCGLYVCFALYDHEICNSYTQGCPSKPWLAFFLNRP